MTRSPGPPRLVRRRDGVVFLVEGRHHRALPTQPLRDALARTLGDPRDDAGGDLDAFPADPESPVELVLLPGLAPLAESSPHNQSLAVIDATVSADRAVQRFAVHQSEGDGARVLDRLAVTRARGVTHLLVPATAQQWLERSSAVSEHLAGHATIVATNDDGALWRLAPPPAAGDAKVFGIGLTKTATTSLHLACELLGIRSLHWGDRQARQAVLEAQRDGERLLHYVGEEFGAYSDIESLSQRFELADLQYPGSRFVLTIRDVDGWIDSQRRHVENNIERQRAGTYHGGHTRINEDVWRARWNAHIEKVTAYFADRDDLLVLNVAAGDGWDQLAPFLGFPVPSTPFPHGNRGLPV